MQEQMSWVGLQVGDYLVEEQLGEGAFSYVYRAFDLTGLKPAVAIKVSKPPEFISLNRKVRATSAKVLWSGFVQDVHPDSAKLLSIQANKLRSFQHSSLLKVETPVTDSGGCYYIMELLQGQTLRQIWETAAVPGHLLLRLAVSLSELSHVHGWDFHGDLKPENIFVTGDRLVLLDPGFFGKIQCREGDLQVSVTTPEYYPDLQPDDLLAFGIIIWEAVCGVHPLLSGQDAANDLPHSLGEDVLQQIEARELAGRFELSPLRRLQKPEQTKPWLNPQLRNLLLKGLRLEEENGKIHRNEGFKSFDEVVNELSPLLNQLQCSG